MTIRDLIEQYLNGDIDAIQAIRDMTGIINPDAAVDIIVVINMVTRHKQGDLDTETFKKLVGITKEEDNEQ